MSTGIRLICLWLLQLGVIGWQVWKKSREKLSYAQALAFLWQRVVLGAKVAKLDFFVDTVQELSLAHYCWWLLIITTVWVWLTTGGIVVTVLLGLVMLIHLYWYGQSRKEIQSGKILGLDGEWGLVFHQIQVDSIFTGKSLAELDWRKQNLLVLAIKRAGQWQTFPKGSERLRTEDGLVLFGELHCYRQLLPKQLDTGDNNYYN